MENKMSLIHHTVKWWGCDYTNKDDKGLSERTQRHLMLKPQVQADVDGVEIREGIKLR
jgi:hypothetical protein